MISLITLNGGDSTAELSYSLASGARDSQFNGYSSAWYFTSALYEIKQPVAATLSNLSCKVSLNTRTVGTVLNYKINGSPSNQSITIGAGLTGEFTDASNTDSITATHPILLTCAASSSGSGDIQFSTITSICDSTGIQYGLNAGPTDFVTSGSTRFIPLHGRLTTSPVTLESQSSVRQSIKGTFKSISVNVSVNTRSTATLIKSRKNSVDGNLLITVPSTTTGIFTDTTGSDIFGFGDDINLALYTTDGTGTLTVGSMSSLVIPYDPNNFNLLASQQADLALTATSFYFKLFGDQRSSSRTDSQTQYRFPLSGYKAKNFRVNISSNTIASSSTMYFRKNGTNTSLSVSIPASTTGFFEDLTNEVDLSSGDNINYCYTSGGSGNLLFRNASVGFFKSRTWLTGWSKRSPQVTDYTLIPEAVSYVPVFLSKCDASWWATVLSDGADIRVTTSDGRILSHYLVPSTFNTTTKKGCLLVDTKGYLSTSANKTLYVYCGNAGASSTSNSAMMFSGSGCVGFYLPGETLNDLTEGGRNLTAVGSPGTAASAYEGVTAATYSAASSQYHYYAGTPAVTAWPVTWQAFAYANNTTDRFWNGHIYRILGWCQPNLRKHDDCFAGESRQNINRRFGKNYRNRLHDWPRRRSVALRQREVRQLHRDRARIVE